jgi:hypothetical protein
MQLRHLGRDGYRRLIAADLATARELRLAIEASSDFELLASGLSVVCFRHRPPGWIRPGWPLLVRTGLVWTGLVWTGTPGRYWKSVQLGGRTDLLAGTTVDGAQFALRACIVNPGLTAARVPACSATSDRAAELLSAS